jgi:hypothetical protein
MKFDEANSADVAAPTAGAGRAPVIAYQTPAVVHRARYSGTGAASCALAVVTVAASAMRLGAADPELQRLALFAAPVLNLVGIGLGIAGTTARGRSPVMGSLGLIANVAAMFLAAGCCLMPLD